MIRLSVIVLCLIAGWDGTAFAQMSLSAIPEPQDRPYPGVIRLVVDASDVTRHIFRVKETIPVESGEIILLYPKWLPGAHGPRGAIDAFGGLKIQAQGRPVEWVRDTVDIYAFHVTVPAGASTLELEFQFLSATDGDQGRIVATPEMLNLQWNSVTLYPAGYNASRITVAASLKLPDGWQFASALESESSDAPLTGFHPVSFDILLDSPLFAGRYVKRVDLDSSGPAPVRLNIFADHPDLLEAKPEHLDAHRALVTQAYRLFNSHHYDHYDFLLALSDRLGGIGLEHHRSSENGTTPTFFTEWDKNPDARELLPHEYTHSWNGKFRRPADLTTPNFNVPMRDSLLWVYEGQTQYWGYVLSARAGLVTKDEALAALAATAAVYQYRVGREWRALQDTTNDPIIAMRRPIPWRSWQRSEDYYQEGELMWLDADTLIREQSNGQKSLDDFARAFFGVDNGQWQAPKTYTFDEVVAALNAVLPHDWAAFLRARLDRHDGPPLDGLARGGYTLTYSETPTDYFKKMETRGKIAHFAYSLGFIVGRENKLSEVLWNTPAYRAGLTVGAQLIAVNGVAYDKDRLLAVIKAAKTDNAPIEFLVKNGDRYSTVRIDYHDGSRYPQLTRNAAVPARIDAILAPRP
ncbi:MAG: M61 family metallopeptidase [Hyphomicrobiales bacterium]|nr:M61 family metallopeptidase [Hyphomicrobiales bacterium]MBV8826446.1 M61 family metallopeptidase [Hyphomicrobiales bacterium]MBV9427767.1 M61 family metallopeptidase [Bradyrhizobiaceae bacterium]